jgi:hypothetical protein
LAFNGQRLAGVGDIGAVSIVVVVVLVRDP